MHFLSGQPLQQDQGLSVTVLRNQEETTQKEKKENQSH